MTPRSTSNSSSASNNTQKGTNPDTINYTINCTDLESGQTDTATGSCGFPQGMIILILKKKMKKIKIKLLRGKVAKKIVIVKKDWFARIINA